LVSGFDDEINIDTFDARFNFAKGFLFLFIQLKRKIHN